MVRRNDGCDRGIAIAVEISEAAKRETTKRVDPLIYIRDERESLREKERERKAALADLLYIFLRIYKEERNLKVYVTPNGGGHV